MICFIVLQALTLSLTDFDFLDCLYVTHLLLNQSRACVCVCVCVTYSDWSVVLMFDSLCYGGVASAKKAFIKTYEIQWWLL
jgi:hypothetical protein